MTKILLVEDDKSLREIYGVRLSAEGYEIVAAGDGEEALAIAVKERPDLIISDVMMPKISGFDMLDILRATPETKDLKVIMMTALSSDDQRQRGEALGANRYLVKSQVGIEDIVRAVHEVLGDTPGTQPTPAADFENVQAPIERAEDSVPLGVPMADTPVEATTTPPIEAPSPEVPQQPAPPQTMPAEPEVPQQPTPLQAVPTEQAQPITPTVSTLPPEPSQPPTAPVNTPISSLSSNTIDQPAHELPSPTAPFSTPAPESLRDQAMPQVAQPTLEAPVPAPVATPAAEPTPVPAPAPVPTEMPTLEPATEPAPVATPAAAPTETPIPAPAAPATPQTEQSTYAPNPQIVPTTEQPATPEPTPAPFTPPQPLDRSNEPDFAQMLNDELTLNDPSQPPIPPATQ